jgi:hypothetical protein
MSSAGGLADLFMASAREEEAASRGPPPVELVKTDEFDLVTAQAVGRYSGRHLCICDIVASACSAKCFQSDVQICLYHRETRHSRR